MDVLVIGDRDTVIGFKLAGVSSALEVRNPEEAKAALKSAFQQRNVGVIMIPKKLAQEIKTFISKLTEESDFPIIVEIPGKEGVEEEVDALRELIRKAVGIEIKF